MQQRQLALQQVARARQRHDAGGLQDREPQRQVSRVLGDLGLARLALLLQRLEPWDHHDEQLQDDAGGDVGHDPEREDRQLQQRPAREQVHQAVQARVLALGGQVDALLHVGDVHPRRRDLRSGPEDHDDHQDEQQLAPQVRRPESVGESA